MSSEKKTYISGITGFRAIAALMVVFYHLKLPFAQGGLLGVTVFFVLSGFLVTRNLLKEAEQKKTIDFAGFWKKRILRLIPALVFLIAVTVIVFAVFNRVLFTKECGDIFSALTGWNNWHQIFSNVSYFENAGAPSPLTHTWSLSIEMQFYLIISILFVLISRSGKRKNLLAGISAAGIIVSTLLMFILFDPASDPTRVYYGTDTRIFSLLAGSLLAVYEKELRGFFDHPLVSFTAGIVSLAALLAMMIFISGYSSFMFRGGQIIATLLACLVTVSLFKENTVFSRIFSAQPLKWIGDHSYAIYLWHYPLMLMMTNGQKAKLSDVLLVSGLTVFFTLISDLFIETPFAAGTIGGMIRILRSTPKTKKAQKRQQTVRRVFIPTACVEGLLVVCAALCVAFVPRENALANMEELEKQAEEAAAKTDEKIKEREEAAAAGADPVQTDEPAVSEEPAAVKKSDEEIINEIDILLIGDSVSLGASDTFYEVFPNSICDAAVSRYTTESFNVYDEWRYEHDWDGDGVIFALGANGMLYDSLPTLRSMIGEERPFFLMTARAPYTEWADINNEEIRTFAEEHENTYVIDWYAASEGHDEYFVEDGTHLTPDGSAAYVECIREKILEVFGN